MSSRLRRRSSIIGFSAVIVAAACAASACAAKVAPEAAPALDETSAAADDIEVYDEAAPVPTSCELIEQTIVRVCGLAVGDGSGARDNAIRRAIVRARGRGGNAIRIVSTLKSTAGSRSCESGWVPVRVTYDILRCEESPWRLDLDFLPSSAR